MRGLPEGNRSGSWLLVLTEELERLVSGSIYDRKLSSVYLVVDGTAEPEEGIQIAAEKEILNSPCKSGGG